MEILDDDLVACKLVDYRGILAVGLLRAHHPRGGEHLLVFIPQVHYIREWHDVLQQSWLLAVKNGVSKRLTPIRVTCLINALSCLLVNRDRLLIGEPQLSDGSEVLELTVFEFDLIMPH